MDGWSLNTSHDQVCSSKLAPQLLNLSELGWSLASWAEAKQTRSSRHERCSSELAAQTPRPKKKNLTKTLMDTETLSTWSTEQIWTAICGFFMLPGCCEEHPMKAESSMGPYKLQNRSSRGWIDIPRPLPKLRMLILAENQFATAACPDDNVFLLQASDFLLQEPWMQTVKAWICACNMVALARLLWIVMS